MSGHRFAVQFGKVRVNTAISPEQRVLTSTSRISAFDSVLPFDVDNKGTILQAISTFFFNCTRDIVPNHFIGCLDAHSMLVKSGRVLPLEVIVRATLSGSLWRSYKNEGREAVQRLWGISLPEGLRQHERFAAPIVTFTTKAAFGHDEVVTPTEAARHVQDWLETQPTMAVAHLGTGGNLEAFANTLVDEVQQTAIKLFQRGQEVSKEAGLLLMDTKYEFALDSNNKLMLVDEIHTPDASRFVDLKQFEAGQIEHLSKEWLREIVQAENSNFERSAATEQERQMPFVLRPFWNYDSFKLKLANGLAHQYHALFERLFPQLTPWDIISPHLVPWPVDPSTMRTAENLQRLPSNVLVVGSGGRDYTIASFVERAAEVDVVYCWPGRDSWTGGKKASLGKISSDELVRFCKEKNIGWAVFGPEIPIAQGIAEKLRASGIPCLAPDLDGAMLESSKIHTKDVLKRSGCPTAESWTLGWNELKNLAANSNNSNKSQRSILDEYPYVLKYESLAAGKGVCLVFNPQERAEAIAHFEKNLPEWTRDLDGIAVDTYTRRKGEPQFLVEKLLPGKEISAIALCHGEDFKLLPYAQDYKRRNNGQTGPNTGGMGAVCPVALDPALDSQIHSIFSKTLRTLKNDGQPYRGFLFAGLMVDDNNVAQVLEFNCRLGDPETQVILPGLGRDLLLSMWLASKNESWSLNPWTVPGQETSVKHDGLNRCFVVVSSPEYPDSAAPARILSVPDSLTPGCEWIPAGTDAGNKTSAGRIGGILAAATDRQRAVQEAYAQTEKITFISAEKSRPHYRTDITFPDMKCEQERR